MSNRPDTALKILQLLLRCGMVCQEELNIVLDAMAAGPGDETRLRKARDHRTAR
jgi:hypothetical protein